MNRLSHGINKTKMKNKIKGLIKHKNHSVLEDSILIYFHSGPEKLGK
jgi:hypothetical protein